ISEDCRNAPKKEYVKEFNIAFAKSETEKILDMMTDDAVWELIGDKTYHGKEQIKQALKAMSTRAAKELIVDNILSHGNKCAANGTVVFAAGKSHFSDFYIFSSHARDAKIKRLISYGIESAS